VVLQRTDLGVTEDRGSCSLISALHAIPVWQTEGQASGLPPLRRLALQPDSIPQSWVQGVSQAVTQEVDAQDGQGDEQAGPEDKPGRQLQKVLAIVQ
jgi:hypothetical protein